jgi:ankyrin repeat protein
MRNTSFIVFLSVLIMLSGCKENDQITDNGDKTSSDKTVEISKVVKELKPAGPEFFEAALNGEIVAVKAAIKSGVDVNTQNADKRTAIMLAAFNGHTDTVKLLIENGADVNTIEGNGRTSLMFAASGDNAETVKLLLDNNAKVDVTDNVENFTAFMFAAAEGQLENVKLLLEYNADWKMVDVDGDSARTFAANNGHSDVVEFIDSNAAKKND